MTRPLHTSMKQPTWHSSIKLMLKARSSVRTVHAKDIGHEIAIALVVRRSTNAHAKAITVEGRNGKERKRLIT